jgi:hypothetical protein
VPFSYYERLSPAQKRLYRMSDAIEAVAIPPGPSLAPLVAGVRAALAAGETEATRAACQALVNELAARFRVPRIRVEVLAARPLLRDGELHGLYEPDAHGRPVRIRVWMRTARRRQLVAFRTFLRTLVHEFCHHLDFEHYGLSESFHTEGFYKRESSLMRQLLGPGESAL